jgi:hypothetical protein
VTIDIDAPTFLLGMPRSGTTWLSQIFESSPDLVVRLSPPYSWDFGGRLDLESGADEWRAVLQGAIDSQDKYVTQNYLRERGELPELGDKSGATRLAVKDTRFHPLYVAGMTALPAARTVYIVRNPGAVLWSWRVCKEFPADADFRDQWRSGACRKVEGPGEYWGFDDWLDLTTSFLKLADDDPERYLVVRYEDLVTQPLETTERMFSFCGLALRQATLDFLRASQSTFDPRTYSVFKGPKLRDDWRRELPSDIYAEIEKEAAVAGLDWALA